MYFLLFFDDYTRMSWVYFIKNKFEVFACFQDFLSSLERQLNSKLKVISTNRRGEYMPNKFRSFCSKLGVKHDYTAPYSPQQNGAAERKNSTLVEKVRSMLNFKQLLFSFQAEVVSTAVYLSNLSKLVQCLIEPLMKLGLVSNQRLII